MSVSLKTLFLSIFLLSCSDNLQYIGMEVIDGKISATQSGYKGARNRTLPKIWVQSSKQTKEVSIPFEYEGRWKVGDTCLLIIEKYKDLRDSK
jgi:hypothetical protein